MWLCLLSFANNPQRHGIFGTITVCLALYGTSTWVKYAKVEKRRGSNYFKPQLVFLIIISGIAIHPIY
jgi:hypothetical protein